MRECSTFYTHFKGYVGAKIHILRGNNSFVLHIFMGNAHSFIIFKAFLAVVFNAD